MSDILIKKKEARDVYDKGLIGILTYYKLMNLYNSEQNMENKHDKEVERNVIIDVLTNILKAKKTDDGYRVTINLDINDDHTDKDASYFIAYLSTARSALNDKLNQAINDIYNRTQY